MLESANYTDLVSIFFSSLNCINLVWHVMLTQITWFLHGFFSVLWHWVSQCSPFSQICVYSCSTLRFGCLTKANEKPRRNDIRVAATCPCKNAKIFTGPHNTCRNLPHSLPFCSACKSLNSALWLLPSAIAASVLRPVWADLSLKLGTVITIIRQTRTASGVKGPYYQYHVSLFFPTQWSAQCWLLLCSLKASSTYSVYRKHTAKLEPLITQISPGGIFTSSSILFLFWCWGQACSVLVTDWSKVGCKRPCQHGIVCSVVDFFKPQFVRPTVEIYRMSHQLLLLLSQSVYFYQVLLCVTLSHLYSTVRMSSHAAFVSAV